MSDIAMCKGTGCPVKEQCYRFTAKPNEFRQSYFVEVPFKDGKCEMFWGGVQDNILEDLIKIVNKAIKK
jgi:hypothetical protein